MSDSSFSPYSLPVVHLMPGELHIAKTPTFIKTTLGSCVSVCFYVARFRMGAMCHGMLPSCAREPKDVSFRYVDSSVLFIVETFLRQGALSSEMKVKLFGGADVLESMTAPGQGKTIGALNIVAAKKWLQKYNLSISQEQVGGKSGYRLLFNSGTGEVRVERLAEGNFR